MLHAIAGAERVSLISRRRFVDFDLSFEWRLLAGGNSGELYKVLEDGEAPWQSGPEMQLLDPEAQPDAQLPETSCGALYGLLMAFAIYYPDRPILTMATATPIANTVAEAWVMARYLRPELLEELEYDFDFIALLPSDEVACTVTVCEVALS